MIDALLSIVAPHLCCGCGKLGSLLCDNCKYNIIDDLDQTCMACEKPCGGRGICHTCRVPYSRAWQVGPRRDALQRLIGLYKFERTRSAYRPLGDLLLAVLPELPIDAVIVPVPTVTGHIRERGYDHAVLVARYIAKKRRLRYNAVLRRQTATTQRHASAAVRRQQAQAAFVVDGPIIPSVPYILIDDVVTTGATINRCAQLLLDAGAAEVWVAVVARQPLE